MLTAGLRSNGNEKQDKLRVRLVGNPIASKGREESPMSSSSRFKLPPYYASRYRELGARPRLPFIRLSVGRKRILTWLSHDCDQTEKLLCRSRMGSTVMCGDPPCSDLPSSICAGVRSDTSGSQSLITRVDILVLLPSDSTA